MKKELLELLTKIISLNNETESNNTSEENYFVGKKVIVRTYSAGVFFGEIIEKKGEEIILKNARRLYYWKTINNGISLSEVANEGLHEDSKICAATSKHWVMAIELIECSAKAIKNIEAQNEFTA